jgi:hypothetical protein
VRRRGALQFSIGPLRVVEQAPGAEAAGDSRAHQEEADSSLAWEQTGRMCSGGPLFLALLQTLLRENLQAAWLRASPAPPVASSPRVQVAQLALAVPPQGQRVARQASKLRVERMQALEARWLEASRAVPRVEGQPQAWPRRELVQPQLVGYGLQEQGEPQLREAVAEAPQLPASCEPL